VTQCRTVRYFKNPISKSPQELSGAPRRAEGEEWSDEHDYDSDAEEEEIFIKDEESWSDTYDEENAEESSGEENGPSSGQTHTIDPFGIDLDRCTEVIVGNSTSKVAMASIDCVVNSAVNHINLGPNEANCLRITSDDRDFPPEELVGVVKLTIRSSSYGRHQLMTIPTDQSDPVVYSGFAWQDDADGIYYCAALGDTIVFEEFPVGDGIYVNVEAEIVPQGEVCMSDFLSFGGYVPPASEASVASTAVNWSSHRYSLRASAFEYKVATEPKPVTLLGATSIDISGDPGSDDYCSIEISWFDTAGVERRFYTYLSADQEEWRVDEIWVYGMNTMVEEGDEMIDDRSQYPDWVYFYDVNIEGNLEEEFKSDNFAIFSSDGDYVRFENFVLRTFLPWSSEIETQAGDQVGASPSDTPLSVDADILPAGPSKIDSLPVTPSGKVDAIDATAPSPSPSVAMNDDDDESVLFMDSSSGHHLSVLVMPPLLLWCMIP